MDDALTIFMSYARDSAEHLAWVTNLAGMLEARPDFHVVFDQYDLHGGKDLTHFMDRAAASDRVVVVMTPAYVERSGERVGGVGYESSIISADILADQLSTRVIPVLRAGSDLPSFLKSKIFVDFRDDKTFATAFGELVSALHGISAAERPAKGPPDRQMAVQARAIVPVRDVPAPVIVAALPSAVLGDEYFGPITVENVGERDAFNIDFADISNRSRLARFSRIARLRPGESVAVVPVIDGVETRNGAPDLYAFAWLGQIGMAWDLVANDPRVVPEAEIDEIVRRAFVAPIRISYVDATNRSWVTHGELILGRDHAGRHRLVIEFRRVEPALE